MLADKLKSALDSFKTGSPNLLGVDISATSIKMVELAEAGKGAYRLERYTIEPLPKDVVATATSPMWSRSPNPSSAPGAASAAETGTSRWPCRPRW